MFEFEFMRHAFVAASLIGLLSGFVGWFLVLRGQCFTGHALSHIGFVGATGAALIGLSPLAGMTIAALVGGGVMGWEGNSDRKTRLRLLSYRESNTGIILAASMGLGLLFLHWQNAPTSSASAILFGNILGISQETLWLLFSLSLPSLGALLFLARPLIFASLDPDFAAARGVSVRWLNLGFMAIVAMCSALCAEITGILLVFSLLVGPAATMLELGLSPWYGLIGSASLAMTLSWIALTLAWVTDLPVAFWISFGAALCYGIANLSSYYRSNGRSRQKPRDTPVCQA